MKPHSLALLLLSAGILAASPALAISRYNTMSMSCASVQDRLDREGAAILRYPSSNGKLTLYDRYVRSQALCSMDEAAVRATVPTRDSPACPVRLCKPYNMLPPSPFPFHFGRRSD